jgi:hypothetical protein
MTDLNYKQESVKRRDARHIKTPESNRSKPVKKEIGRAHV